MENINSKTREEHGDIMSQEMWSIQWIDDKDLTKEWYTKLDRYEFEYYIPEEQDSIFFLLLSLSKYEYEEITTFYIYKFLKEWKSISSLCDYLCIDFREITDKLYTLYRDNLSEYANLNTKFMSLKKRVEKEQDKKLFDSQEYKEMIRKDKDDFEKFQSSLKDIWNYPN